VELEKDLKQRNITKQSHEESIKKMGGKKRRNRNNCESKKAQVIVQHIILGNDFIFFWRILPLTQILGSTLVFQSWLRQHTWNDTGLVHQLLE